MFMKSAEEFLGIKAVFSSAYWKKSIKRVFLSSTSMFFVYFQYGYKPDDKAYGSLCARCLNLWALRIALKHQSS